MDRQEIRFLLNYLENNRNQLNSLQYEFLTSSKAYYNATWVLTKRQIECLIEIKEDISSPAPGKAVFESESAAQYSSFDHLTPFRM